MFIKFTTPTEIELLRWICNIIHEMTSAKVINNPNDQCEISFDGMGNA